MTLQNAVIVFLMGCQEQRMLLLAFHRKGYRRFRCTACSEYHMAPAVSAAPQVILDNHGIRSKIQRNEWLIGVNPVSRSFFVQILSHVNRIDYAVKKCVAYQRKSDLCDKCTLFL